MGRLAAGAGPIETEKHVAGHREPRQRRNRLLAQKTGPARTFNAPQGPHAIGFQNHRATEEGEVGRALGPAVLTALASMGTGPLAP